MRAWPKTLERIKFEYEQLKRYIYGRRSERHVEDDSQLSLFDESEEVANSDADANEKVIEITYERRQRSKKARFPESLPREGRGHRRFRSRASLCLLRRRDADHRD